jgi:alanyl-tRNA synthetase
VVQVGDWEVEACAGTHVNNTSEIGLIKIINTERVQDGVERIVFSTGLYAVEAIQKNDELLRNLSETLDAPLKKLLPTTKRLLKEYKEARRDKERLIKEIALKESSALADRMETKRTKKINGLQFITQEYELKDFDRMIQTANALIKQSLDAIVLFYAKNRETTRFVVMVGQRALDKGVNASEIAKEAAKMIEGGGSGRPEFAQGGGIQVNKVNEMVQKAEDVLRVQLKESHNK